MLDSTSCRGDNPSGGNTGRSRTMRPGRIVGLALIASMIVLGHGTAAGARVQVREFTVPTAGSGPSVIVQGRDGALWFTEQLGNSIGRIDATGSILEYPVPT